MDTQPDMTAELAALAARVEETTRQLHVLRERAPELRNIVSGVEGRLVERTDELARAASDAEQGADRIVLLRSRLGSLEQSLDSSRRRVGDLANILDPS
jgi:capsule polysaccharide export protein KpsE/RkpR